MHHEQQRRCEHYALSVVVVLFISKKYISASSRDAITTIYRKKVVRGSGQLRGLLGWLKVKALPAGGPEAGRAK